MRSLNRPVVVGGLGVGRDDDAGGDERDAGGLERGDVGPDDPAASVDVVGEGSTSFQPMSELPMGDWPRDVFVRSRAG